MTNQIIFYTQITSILAFILVIFILYRVLVSQKDSLIELLHERNKILETEKDNLLSQSPDMVVTILSRRISIATDEIERLFQETTSRDKEIQELKYEIEILKNAEEILILSKKIYLEVRYENWDRVIEIADKITNLNGIFDVYHIKALALSKLSKYEKAYEVASIPIVLEHHNGKGYYNRACIGALAGKPIVRIISDLKKAILKNKRLADNLSIEKDLQSINKTSEFIDLMEWSEQTNA